MPASENQADRSQQNQQRRPHVPRDRLLQRRHPDRLALVVRPCRGRGASPAPAPEVRCDARSIDTPGFETRDRLRERRLEVRGARIPRQSAPTGRCLAGGLRILAASRQRRHAAADRVGWCDRGRWDPPQSAGAREPSDRTATRLARTPSPGSIVRPSAADAPSVRNRLSETLAPVTLSGSPPSATSPIIHPGDCVAMRLETVGALPPVAELFVRHERSGPEGDQPLGVGVGKRPQQDAANHGEDRRIGAGAEREQRDGDGGERLDDGRYFERRARNLAGA